MTGPRVIVVGALHHDIIVTAERQPERGETLMGRSWRTALGGKGANQAVAARRCGAEVSMVGAVGEDEMGTALLHALSARGVDCEGVVTIPATGSGMSIATIDDAGDYAAVVVSGANKAIDPDRVARCGIGEGDVVVLQNEVPEAVNMAAAQAARAAGARLVWNAAPMRDERAGLLSLIDVLVVNAVEARQMCALEVADLAGAQSAAQALGADGVASVVTAGAHGFAARDPGGTLRQFPAIAVEHPVAHGAGDAFVGTLAAEMAAGAAFFPALEAANTAAARHVGGANRAG
ncbi:MAG: PfkB family carbohydrate kinase [Pseudomonadota bacterium]